MGAPLPPSSPGDFDWSQARAALSSVVASSELDFIRSLVLSSAESLQIEAGESAWFALIGELEE